MVKVEEGQVETVVVEDGLLEQDMHLELDRLLDTAEVVDRRKYELLLSETQNSSRNRIRIRYLKQIRFVVETESF